jgi:hypothetical protein
MLAESPEHLVKKWQKSTHLSEQAIATRLFNSIYGLKPVAIGGLVDSEEKTTETSTAAGVLFAMPANECERLRHFLDDPERLRLELEGLGYGNIKEFASRCKDDEDLKLAFNLLICSEKDH